MKHILLTSAFKQHLPIFKYIQYNTVKLNLKRSAVLFRFRDSLGLKKAKKRKIPDLIYLWVHPIDSV